MNLILKIKIFMTCLVAFVVATNCKDQSNETDDTEAKNKITMNQTIGKDFGKKYAAAWSGQNAEAYSKFFARNGSLSVNNGDAALGRTAIAKVAQGFMTAFPDMLVALNSLPRTSKGVEFHWILTGTNSGPNGTGKKVHISGVEILPFDDNGLITESKGSYDETEYNRQLKYGVED